MPARRDAAVATAKPNRLQAAIVADFQPEASKAGLYRDLATDTYGRVYVREGKLWASMDAGDGPGDSVGLRRPGGPARGRRTNNRPFPSVYILRLVAAAIIGRTRHGS